VDEITLGGESLEVSELTPLVGRGDAADDGDARIPLTDTAGLSGDGIGVPLEYCC